LPPAFAETQILVADSISHSKMSLILSALRVMVKGSVSSHGGNNTPVLSSINWKILIVEYLFLMRREKPEV
jgi:hypothetical protein